MALSVVSFFVSGVPCPAGSKRAFVVGGGERGHRAVVVDACRGVAEWKAVVRAAGRRLGGVVFLKGPVLLGGVFLLARPRWHFRGGEPVKGLRPSAPAWHCVRPDLSKLVRAVEDGLRGVLFWDDGQVSCSYWGKRYVDVSAGCGVCVVAGGEDDLVAWSERIMEVVNGKGPGIGSAEVD